MEQVKKGSALKAAILSLIFACATALCVAMPNQAWAAEYEVDTKDGFLELFDADGAGDIAAGDTVKIKGAIDLGGETIDIMQSVTIEGVTSDAAITSSAKKVFRINYKNATNAAVDVEFANLSINTTYPSSGAPSSACVNTYAGSLENLTLENVKLTGAYQPLTIGGDAGVDGSAGTMKVLVKDSTITSTGYAIIVFNPVNMTIESSSVEGYTALYMKSDMGYQNGQIQSNDAKGSLGSTVVVKNGSVLNGVNNSSSPSNAFATVVIEEEDVSVSVEDSVIKAQSNGAAAQSIASFGSTMTGLGTDSEVAIKGKSTVETNAPESLIFDEKTASNNTVVFGVGVTANTSEIASYLADGAAALVQADGKTVKVMTESDAEASAAAKVTTDGIIVYYESVSDANNAAAGNSSSVVEVIEKPEVNEGGQGTATPSSPSDDTEDTKESEKTSTPKTGDATPFAALGFGVLALIAAGALVATRKVL